MNDSSVQHDSHPTKSIEIRPLRIWPAVLLLLGMLVTRFLPMFFEDQSDVLLMTSVLGPMLGGVFVFLWWLTFSRATGKEKLLGGLGVIVAGGVASLLLDETMFGPGLMIVTVPVGMAAFAIGAMLVRSAPVFKRTIIAVLIAACGFGFSDLLRSSGMWGNGKLDLAWRWQRSAEENVLALRETKPPTVTTLNTNGLDQHLANPEWPRFRGLDGNSRVHQSKINTNWSANAPQELWRISIGPGWSSFVVAGNLLFTQEQLGDNETVVCYTADEGKEVWRHSIESRFFDSLGGPGPRATPTLAGSSIFALGGNGQLQRLDAKTGELEWSKDIRDIADRKPPEWGFASSPLVVGSNVIVHAGGAGDKGTLAFDVESGELAWSVAAGDHSYSSAESYQFDGQTYVLMLTNDGMNVIDPEAGKSVLDYEWKYTGYRALQPQVLDDQSVLLSTQHDGTRRIKLSRNDDGSFNAEEVWTTRNIKPDFNDFVIHQGHAYGFDGTIFTCVDLETGDRKWKRGRYGKGQVLLLAASNALLVMSENGKIVLLDASPEAHKEIAELDAFTARTWNHPVVIGDKLYVRNSEEAACFQLPL